MIKKILTILTVGLICSSSSAQESVDFGRVLDGDTFFAKINGREVKVRLIGADAPEHGQVWCTEAQEFTQSFLKDHKVHIEYDKQSTDLYGRTLAYVLDDNNLNLSVELVRKGLAFSLFYRPNIKYKGLILDAEKSAKCSKVGIWSTDRPLLTHPKDFRAKRKMKTTKINVQ